MDFYEFKDSILTKKECYYCKELYYKENEPAHQIFCMSKFEKSVLDNLEELNEKKS